MLRNLGMRKIRLCRPTRSDQYNAGPGEVSLRELIATPAKLPASRLADIRIDPTDPCIFQLSGGTTGIPKLIPRTNNDYAYNSKVAAEVTEITADSTLLLVLPIAHNLPLACPGIQGFLFKGAKVVLHGNTRPVEMFSLIEKHKVTHLKVVPALLIRLINDPAVENFNETAFVWSNGVLRDLGKLGWIAAFIYVAGAALRLARFNTQVETADKRFFTGLASPAAAAVIAGTVWAGYDVVIELDK